MTIASALNHGPPSREAGDAPQAIRADSDLGRLDVAAAITRFLSAGGGPRRELFAEAAIAAAIEAEGLEIGPVPVGFLGRFVRTGGIAAALQLPEPLVGDEPTKLARRWLEAAQSAGGGVPADLMLGRWLEMVAALMAARRSARAR
jgi:hypothetical protein